jgi:peptidoglycan/LPS O-acetylase OafA/YrhL
MFFVLSGYLLYRPFCKAISNAASIEFADFYMRRLLRIYPAFVLSVAAFTAARYAMKLHPPSLSSIILHLLFIFNTSNHLEFYGINGVLWTLAIEMQFYFVLPISVVLVRWIFPSRPNITIFGTAVLFLCVGMASRAVELSCTTGPGAIEKGVVRYHLVFSFLDLFAAGMFVAALSGVDKSVRILNWRSSFLLTAGGFALYFSSNQWCAAVSGGDWMEVNAPIFLWLFPPMLCSGIAMILFVVLRGDGWLSSILAASPLVYIGRISYSVYLFHFLVLVPMFGHMPLAFIRNYQLKTFCWGCVSLGPTLILATGTYYLSERPFMRLAEHFRPGKSLLPPIVSSS